MVALTTLPIENPRPDLPTYLESLFRARVLRYLEWFGLLEKLPAAANDDLVNQFLYRKTPLYDRFLSFDLGGPTQ